jgi:hypothetical protein
MLQDAEAKKAYDRLAASKFQDHDCKHHGWRQVDDDGLFARARKLVSGGLKPKDAVDIAIREISLEYRGDAKKIEQAQAEGEAFLRQVKDGRI